MMLWYSNISVLLLFCPPPPVQALQNLFGNNNSPTQTTTTSSPFTIPFFQPPSIITAANNKNNNNNVRIPPSTRKLEQELLSLIESQGQRLANSDDISNVIAALEQVNPIPEPAISSQVYGRWKLLYTTKADTSSPIQRNAVNAQTYTIYQDIIVMNNNNNNNLDDENDDDNNRINNKVLQVNQIVEFSDVVRLSVNALASTSAYPLPEFTERQGTGKILGLNLLGVSLVGEDAKPKNVNSRIDFVFDEGNFYWLKKKKKQNDKTTDSPKNEGAEDQDEDVLFKIPYPVPFRWPLFRDAVKGWIDITYLSDRVRIARGNKGTTFVLEKQPE